MDDFSPEEMREFNESLNSMNASMGPLSQALSNLARDLGSLSEETKKSAKQQEEYRKSGRTKRDEYTDEGEDKIKKQAEELASALRTSTLAVGAFSGALISGIDGLGKYGDAVKGFGESAKQTGEALGGFSKYVGRAVNIMSQFLDTALKQADAQNQFIKDMNNIGVVIDTTTQGLADAARQAGASARDLEGLSVILQGASKAMTAFGAGTSDGANKLIEVMKLSNEQEREMRRYSFTLQEAQAEQAYYIELQRTAGTNLNISNLSAQKVREDSLRYAKTLRELSELTGLSSAQLKDQQAAAQADMRNKLRNLMDDNEIGRLNKKIASEENEERKAQLIAQRDQIKEEKQVRSDSLTAFSSTMGSEMAAKLANVIGTGAFDENTKELAVVFGRAGVGAADLQKRFKGLEAGSDEYRQAIVDTQAEFVGGVRKNADDFGVSMMLAENASQIGSIVGLTDATTDTVTQLGLEEEVRERGITVQKRTNESLAKGVDAQKDLVAGLQVLETDVRTASDAFINAMNPFTGVLGASTIGLGFFIGAIGQATIALNAMSASGMINQGANFMGPRMPSKLGKIFSPRNLKIGGGIVAGGVAAYSALSEGAEKNRQADTEYEASTAGQDGSTKEGAAALYRAEQALNAQTKRNDNVYGTKALGGMGGAAGGASLGATIGTFILPGIGTAIGGLIGAGLGAVVGAELAEAVALGLTDLQIEALDELSEEDKLLMSPEEIAAWEIAHKDAQDAMDIAKEQLQVEKDAYKSAKSTGLYDKDWIGDSEVNIKMLAAEMDNVRNGERTAESLKLELEAILRDDDLSAKQQKQVEGELEKLVKLEEDKKEDKGEEKEVVAEKQKDMGRTMDLSPENLAKIFEAEMKAESKQKLEEVVVAAKKVAIPSVDVSGDQGTVNDETGVVELAAGMLEEIVVTAKKKEEQPEKLAAVQQELAEANKTNTELVSSALVQTTMNEATQEFLAYVDSDEGKAEIAQKKADRTAKMAEMKTSAEDSMLSKEGQYREIVETGQYKGKDASESQLSQAEKYLSSIEETKSRRMATAQDMPFGLLNPEIDIEPEPVEGLDEGKGMSTTEFAQRKAEDGNLLAEKIDQLIAVQTEGNAINLKAKNAAVETAETNQKIMQSSIV